MELTVMMSRCVFGENAHEKIGEIVKELKCTKALFIFDKGVWNAGLVKPVVDALENEGIPCVLFDGVMPDPDMEMVNEVGELAKKEEVDLLVAIGGGSSLDTAKAANLLINNPGKISDFFGIRHDLNPGVALIVLPTTAGTGSEVTPTVVLSDVPNNRKMFIKSWSVVPKVAMIDPVMMRGLPPSITASTGIDALSHACEGFTSVRANQFLDPMCLSAVELVFGNLREVMRDGSNMEARTNMAVAATQAGLGFGYGVVHLGHAMAHAMGANWHIPHGVGCALALPFALRHIGTNYDIGRLRQLAGAMGLELPEEITSAEATERIIEEIRKLYKDIGIPTLASLGITRDEMDTIVSATMNEKIMIALSGVELTEERLTEFYEEMFAAQ